MLQLERFFRQRRDIVATFGNNVAENGNNVEATFDFVEKTKFYNRIVRHCCRLWQQSRMLLRHCCWCGRGLKRKIGPEAASVHACGSRRRSTSITTMDGLITRPPRKLPSPTTSDTSKRVNCGEWAWAYITGDESPRVWSEGTLIQIVRPSDFVMFQYFEHHIACITMQ